MRLKDVVLALGVLSAGVACVYAQTRAPGKGATRTSFPIDTTVVVDVKARSVKPLISLLTPGASIELVVKGLATGQTLELDFRVQGGFKGPFARTQRWRGRYTFNADGKITTGPVDRPGEETWKFDVVQRQKDDTEDVWAIDPMIVSKE
ncbi:MAG: hypothetical protein DMF79_01910 [Acidobacteria bacterium]|nr:MAG: hypothetical protein DMF79_01910 [Acidobacteriota bacterium]